MNFPSGVLPELYLETRFDFLRFCLYSTWVVKLERGWFYNNKKSPISCIRLHLRRTFWKVPIGIFNTVHSGLSCMHADEKNGIFQKIIPGCNSVAA